MSTERTIAIAFVVLVILILILAAVFARGSVSDAAGRAPRGPDVTAPTHAA